MFDITTLEGRAALLKHLDPSKNTEEAARIAQSKKECHILDGHIYPYVRKELLKLRDEATVNEMQIVSDMNVTKKIVEIESCVYQSEPERVYSNIEEGDDRLLKIADWHNEGETNKKLKRANKLFRLQSQGALYRTIKDGKPVTKAFKKHQYQVTEIKLENGEVETAYLIPNHQMTTDKMKVSEKKDAQRFTLWSSSYNFVMDGHGALKLGDDIINHIGILPIIDIYNEKDEGFWVTESRNIAEFTLWLNVAFSNLAHIVDMQGFAIGTLSGSIEALSKIETQTIGINKLTKLPTIKDDEGNALETKLEFNAPPTKILEIIDAIKARMYAFFSCEGIEGAVSMSGESEGYSSGWDRLLALIEKFEASKGDIDLFTRVEKKLWKIDKAYLEHYNTNDNLDKRFHISNLESVELEIKFSEPEMIETQKEKEERIAYREDRGWITPIEAVKEVRGVDDDQAAEILLKGKEQRDMYKIVAPISSVKKTEGSDQDNRDK